MIEDGLDRQNIATLYKRFMTVNDDRMERMRGELADRQQLFMDILPLLFHSNHPMLPGFVSRQTPARVAKFKPTKHDVLVGKMVAKSFTISYDPSAVDDIYGIYIMGSVGTIAQSGRSDLDIWICYRPGLKNNQLEELRKKCDKISSWAAESRLEVHFFLMDHEDFKAQKLSELDTESSGSAQHLLLLDEFYRTAIFVAGLPPIWWYVPPQEEVVYREYANTLLYNRFLPDDSVLDFGGVSKIPPGEFLGAGVWQLYKAIESPYKSVLKLLLLESYVADYPKITPLSLTFKELIYMGEININALDSYVMIYQRIEAYLTQKNQPKRLELARRSFYFKVNKALSRPESRGVKSWQRHLMEQFVADWGWTPEYIAHLDSRKHWKAADVAAESAVMVSELNYSYRFLLEFANRTAKQKATIASDELMVLGRKLQAAYERRPGKIDWVNPNISQDLAESVVEISCLANSENTAMVWVATSLDRDAMHSTSNQLKSSSSLVELLFWCYYNGVITDGTRLTFRGESDVLTPIEQNRLLNVFQEWCPDPGGETPHDSFTKSSKPEKMLLLVNTGVSATPNLDSRGYQRMSGRSDALSYGGFEENLVASVDILLRNSWGEIVVRHFEGPNAIVDAMGEYLSHAPSDSSTPPPNTKVVCIGSSHANTITHRLENWMSSINDCFFGDASARHRRFVFQMADSCYCLQYRGSKPQARSFSSETHLVDHLEQEQSKYSQIVLDELALKNHPIRSVIECINTRAINVVYRRFDIGVEMYVVDERGSILHTVFRGRHNHNPLKPLYHFLRAVIYRQAQLYPDLNDDFGIYPIQFFELKRNNRGQYSCAPRQLPQDLRHDTKIQVKAVAHVNNRGELSYDFYCDDQEFLARDLERQLDVVVSQYIVSRRVEDQHYPVYINDLDLSIAVDAISPNHQLQIVHYLRIKNRLEARLNQAIGILLNA